MAETIESFIRKWQTIIAILMAGGFGYGMKSAEITSLSDEI